ncbi:MAG: hypothetical protein KF842_03420 [Caulobacter sp.]|nr:hypothetical protein [Caulobacter sp.]
MMRSAILALGAMMALAATPALAAEIAGAACTDPAPARCDGMDCTASPVLADPGNATDPKTGRKFFLDFPCDLKPGEKVIFILNIHGAGSIGNWQRHYFPALDYKTGYRLVIATPTANGSGAIGAGPPIRMWMPAEDDAYLQNISDLVIDSLGAKTIKAFWLAGHSQGGFTSRRIVCSDYFRDKVDGWLSLSGGRIGQAPVVADFGPPKPDGSPPDPRPPGPSIMSYDATPACDFSHIYEIGEHEITALPTTSPWADKYGCGPRVRQEDIIDEAPGHVWDYARVGHKPWGMKARPGTAQVWIYPGCKGDRLVADVVRLDKGHTEGLEPHVTEAIVRMIAAAPGGKLAGGGK